MELFDVMLKRRSVRQYNGLEISDEMMHSVLQAGLLAPSGRDIKSVEFIEVSDKDMLAKLSKAKSGGAGMLAGASRAIVVVCDPDRTDTWIEDGTLAMIYMHLRATDLGLASCWVQIRNRFAAAESGQVPADDNVKELLKIPEHLSVLSILSLGVPTAIKAPHSELDADFSKVHREKF